MNNKDKDRTGIWVSKEIREKLFSMKDFNNKSVNDVIANLISFREQNKGRKDKNEFRKSK